MKENEERQIEEAIEILRSNEDRPARKTRLLYAEQLETHLLIPMPENNEAALWISGLIVNQKAQDKLDKIHEDERADDVADLRLCQDAGVGL